jgi:hypothetical protein
MQFKNVLTVSTAGVVAALAIGSGGAYAAHMISGKDIRDGSIRSADIRDNGVYKRDLGKGLQAKIDRVGKGGVNDAYYSVAYYDKGDTNAGAIATVACKNETDVALSGGVQVLGLDAGANSRNTPVSSSFPGRMDWSTNTPKADRLDGWIVQFGGNAGATSDKAPEKVKLWALCVPGLDTEVVETYTQSTDG